MDLQKKIFKHQIAGRELSLEVSRLASQANASVLVKYGETIVLATAVMGTERPVNFFPLVVDYEERFYAAGKIIGSRFVRREGRASDEAVLSARLIDRAIRPLFDQRLRREVQVVLTIISIDEENDPDFVSLIAASAALSISDIPWGGPIGGVSVAEINGELKINPSMLEASSADTKFSAFFAGIQGKINMIEASGREAKEENVIVSMEKALKEIENLINFQKSVTAEIGKKKQTFNFPSPSKELELVISDFLKEKLETAVFVTDKKEREKNLSELLSKLKEELISREFSSDEIKLAEDIFEEAVNDAVHKNIIKDSRRPDGRALNELRDLHSEVKLFERTHGSALFMRGDTQSLSVVTLAPPGQEKLIETMETSEKKRFFLHYNFPPYSVGETGSFRGPGRREIGHGALAEKALKPVIPTAEEFPYTIRLVSEILSSNGSSSMATVCAGSLALMDAGVPIKKPVAGIAMGIMTAGSDYKILTDIQGPEDHYGDMDFKVAGTADGITALQMDVKIDGVSPKILCEGLNQAKEARLKILEVMSKAISSYRPETSSYAPLVVSLLINPEKIGALIGPGGKIINGIIEHYGVTIDIEDDGKVFVGGSGKEAVESALTEIKSITREFSVGEIVEGEVVRIMEFGAIIDLGAGRDGMIHVSELKEGFVKNVSDVLKIGDYVRVKIIKIDGDKLGLSIKQLEKK